MKFNDKLDSLSNKDKNEIFKAVRLIYPVQDNSPEITNIEYLVDFEIEDNDVVETNHLEEIDFDYIHQQISKCNEKISKNDYEGSVTNARTLIESVCLYIIENLIGSYTYNGDLIKLYKDVSQEMKMTPGDYSDQNLKRILSGVFSIINGVSELRNEFSDAHGQSPSKLYKVDKRHAILTVNLSKTISEYLYLSYQNRNK